MLGKQCRWGGFKEVFLAMPRVVCVRLYHKCTRAKAGSVPPRQLLLPAVATPPPPPPPPRPFERRSRLPYAASQPDPTFDEVVRIPLAAIPKPRHAGKVPMRCYNSLSEPTSSKSSLSLDSRARQVAAVRWLLDNGANPNHVDKAGYTPLAWACRSGVFPAVVALVEAGADVMLRRPKLPGGR